MITRALSIVSVLVGLGLLALLTVWQGLGPILALLGGAGWGLIAICVFALPELASAAGGWRLLFPRALRPSWADSAVSSWMGYSVNLLLPVAGIGGEVVKLRCLLLRGGPLAETIASVIVDKATQAWAVALSAVIGLGLLLRKGSESDLIGYLALGTLLLLLGTGGFVWVQKRGAVGTVGRMAQALTRKSDDAGLSANVAEADAAVRWLNRQPAAVAGAVAIRLLGGIVMAGEVWLAAWLMGLPIGLAEAIILQSLAMALRGAAFVVPGGIGVQEGGYIAIGALLGLPADMMLSLSLATRLRELVSAVPGLLVWQLSEGRRAWARRGRPQAG